ncbi:phage protein NinX family protein [Enterobacter ludwigii]|uniref:phage protein NinX family protein n=1 Tax=Enterobacter ludwigii TaxID=299767 RepID=UPI003BEEEFCD
MSKVKMNISDLTGSALDYAVDRAVNGKKYGEAFSIIRASGDGFRPSTSWKLCGALMETHSISCYRAMDHFTSEALHWVGVNESHLAGKRRGMVADDPRTAICRAIASTLGGEIDIPTELLKSKGDAK